MIDWLYRRRDPAAAGATAVLLAISLAVWRYAPSRSTTPPHTQEMVVQMEELPPEPPAPPPPPPPPPPPQTPPPQSPTPPRPAPSPAPSPEPTPTPAPSPAPAPIAPAPPAPAPPAPPAPAPPPPAPPAPTPPPPAPPRPADAEPRCDLRRPRPRHGREEQALPDEPRGATTASGRHGPRLGGARPQWPGARLRRRNRLGLVDPRQRRPSHGAAGPLRPDSTGSVRGAIVPPLHRLHRIQAAERMNRLGTTP